MEEAGGKIWSNMLGKCGKAGPQNGKDTQRYPGGRHVEKIFKT